MTVSQSVVSGTVTRLDSRTDPTDKIPNGEAKSRCHPGADFWRCLLSVKAFIDMLADRDVMVVLAASSRMRSIHSAALLRNCATAPRSLLMQPHACASLVQSTFISWHVQSRNVGTLLVRPRTQSRANRKYHIQQ